MSSLVWLTHNISHKIGRKLDNNLVNLGVSGAQMRLLGFLCRTSEEGKEICQTDILEMLTLRASSITSLIKGMEEAGLIERKVSESDVRKKIVIPTKKGWEIHKRGGEFFDEQEELIKSWLTEEEITILSSLLEKISKKLD